MGSSRRVVLVAFDGLQTLDLIGPNEVFSVAGRLVEGAYSVEIVAPGRGFASTRRSPAAAAPSTR
jgi:putative intracellular protease/amidase